MTTIKKLLFLTIIALCISCQKEAVVLDDDCFSEIMISPASRTCEEFSVQDCQKMSLGFHPLSENSLENFRQFCYPLDGKIRFEDIEGNTINLEVKGKFYEVGNSKFYSNLGEPDCLVYCLDNEHATVILASELFSVSINLLTTFKPIQPGIPIEEHFQSSYSIWILNSMPDPGTEFTLPFEDFTYSPIAADNIERRFHPTIRLNNTVFENIWSIESQVENQGFPAYDLVYFSLTEGLVGVKDVQGVLWSKDIND